ncbi:MAG: hypothetical protein HWD59_10160 [Coxiellaceae bacterium]|nr:MAG: hypothetical protein HWD59_10160 [Coxiellaceae bacterium]
MLLLEKLFFKFNKEELKLNLKNTLEKLKESAHVPLFQFLAAKRLCELGEYISAILFLDATFSCLSITPAMPPNAAHLISEQGLGIFKYCLKHLNDEEKENLRFHVNTLAILDGETHDQLYSSISDKTL